MRGVLHDLRCPACDWEKANVRIVGGEFPHCPRCETRTTWRPFLPATDVRGSEQTSEVLWDEFDRPLTYTSSRERDAKMAKLGCVPAGDRKHGALGVGNGPMRGSVTSFGKSQREKSRVGKAEGVWKAT